MHEQLSQPDGERQVFQRLDRTAKMPYGLREYFRRTMWELTRATVYRLAPRRAAGWRAFWLRLFGARLGCCVNIRPGVRIVHPWLLTMGDHSCLGDGVVIYNLGPVVIGEHTVLSQEAYVCAGTHDYTRPDLPLLRSSVTIGRGVWVCAQAFIGPDVTVGDNAVIGARAVVAKNVPPNMVAVGNPAKAVKAREMKGR